MTKKDPKIVFISPPLSDEEQASALKGIANVVMPLGIGYIASNLIKNNFKNVKIIDCRALKITEKKLIDILKKDNFEIICFTTTILDINRVNRLTKELKKIFPNSLFVIGGPQMTSNPKLTMEKGIFDIGVYNEAEFSFVEIVKEYMKDHPDYKNIKGIYFRKEDGTIEFTGLRPFLENLDELPFPARELYPSLEVYRPVPASYKELPSATIVTSRGCPYKCIYCDHGATGNRFRAMSPKRVVDEIKEIMKKYGAKDIRFFDDIFTLNRQRVHEICDEILKRKLKFSWSCMTRTDCVDRNLLFKMKKAGCWQIQYGLESGSQKILDIMKKGLTLKKSRDAVIWAHEAGINVRGFFVVGMPGETKETIQETVDFAKSLPIDIANFYVVTLYPGSELYNIAQKEGTVMHENLEQYNPLIDVEKSTLSYVPKGMTEKELKEAIVKAHRDFYLRTSYLIKQILTIRSLEDIKRYIRGSLAVLNM